MKRVAVGARVAVALCMVPGAAGCGPTVAPASAGAESATTEFDGVRKASIQRFSNTDSDNPVFIFGSAIRVKGDMGKLVEINTEVQRDHDRWSLILMTEERTPFCVFTTDSCLVADPKNPGQWLRFRNGRPRFDWHRENGAVTYMCECTTIAKDHYLNVDLASLLPASGEPTETSGLLEKRIFKFGQFDPEVRVLADCIGVKPRLLGIEYRHPDGELIAMWGIGTGGEVPASCHLVDVTTDDLLRCRLNIVDSEQVNGSRVQPPLSPPAAWVDDPVYRPQALRLKSLFMNVVAGNPPPLADLPQLSALVGHVRGT